MSKLDDIIKDINKHKKYDLISFGLKEKQYEKIHFTSERLNYMTYGGIPRGCLVEFSGLESSGKTSTALDLVKQAQRLFQNEFDTITEDIINNSKDEKTKEQKLAIHNEKGVKKVIYADCENTLDERWAKIIGVDLDKLVILSPAEETAEELFEMFIGLLETGEVGLLVIDSLGVLVSAQAYEKSIEQRTYGGIAMALTTFSKKAVMLCQKHKTTIIGINQVREDIGNPYGGLTTVGGKAWRHNCMLRLMFDKGKFIDPYGNEISKTKAEEPAGNIVNIAIEKTKSCRPDRRRGCYHLSYKKGVDWCLDLIDLAIHLQIITQKGAWYYIYDNNNEIQIYDNTELSFQGKAKLYDFLYNHLDYSKELTLFLRNAWSGYEKG